MRTLKYLQRQHSPHGTIHHPARSVRPADSVIKLAHGPQWRHQPPVTLNVALDQGSGPTIVLVHGIASSTTTFVNLFPLIAEGHRLIAVDILGFGKSPHPDGARYTLEEHVSALEATLRHLRLRGPLVLVGHSLGTLIVMRYAARHPAASHHVVLVSPPIYTSPGEISDVRTRHRMSGYLRIYAYLRTNKEFTIRNARFIARLLPMQHVLEINEENWDPFIKSLENCIESQTSLSDLAAIRVPVDIVYGRFDEFIIRRGLKVAEQLRHVTLHEEPLSDHLIRRPLAQAVARAIFPTSPDGPA